MPQYDKGRASGKTGAFEAAEKEEKGITVDEMQQTVDEENAKRDAMTLSFSRARLDWTKEDREHWEDLREAVDEYIAEAFRSAYAIINDLFDEIGEFQVNPETGELQVDSEGFKVPVISASGQPVLHWSKLTTERREYFIFEISTQMFWWRQTKEDLWAQSIFAKGEATEAFSLSYSQVVGGTIEDRTSYANAQAAKEKYFAIYKAFVSRKADAIIVTMKELADRLVATLKV